MTVLLDPHDARRLEQQAAELPSHALDPPDLAALELLLEGAFAPLRGFALARDADGTPALPLRVGARPAQACTRVALHDSEGVTLAVLEVTQRGGSDAVPTVAGPVHGIRAPVRELFHRHRMPVSAIRATLAASGHTHAVCFSLRGVPDAAARERIARLAGEDAVLLRVMDCGDADRAHQVRQRLDAALSLAALLGEARCVLSVCPDPQPLDGPQQSALDTLYATNAGCARSESIGGGHAPGAPSPCGGLCVFFTGLSGSGKSTLARALHARLIESSGCAVTLLDGDTVRRHLSRGLGFSRADRDANVLRIGYVASRVVMHAGIVICAPIAPYAATRAAVRELVQAHGRFVEVHVAAPLAVCEARDPKGLYVKARSGQIEVFTGVSDPYEAPDNPECRIDTSRVPVAEAVDQLLQVIDALARSGERGTLGLTRHTSS